MSERTVQEVFNLAISEGYYGIGSFSCRYMCNSLAKMHEHSLLSDKEYLNASEEIKLYLLELERKVGEDYHCSLLFDALIKLGVLNKMLSQQEVWEFLSLVYSDWDNRPLIQK